MACSVEFAVKLLKDEIPLPAEVEDLFKKMMCRQKSTFPRPCQSFLNSLTGRAERTDNICSIEGT